jgi:hypothetical protein
MAFPMSRYKAKALPMADGGISDPTQKDPTQMADESFNKDLRDASTNLADISGTASRRGMEFLDQGQQLENQAGTYSGQYYNDYGQAKGDTQAALDTLQQTPGYTPDEASQINVDYGKYQTDPSAMQNRYLTSDEQQAIKGDPNAASTMAGDMSSAIYSTLGTTGQMANSALANEGTGIGQALTGEQASLNKAVDPSQLGLSSQFTQNYQMTPQQQQDIVTAAGTTVGNRYRSAESDLARSAAADGNTSPVAIAAARQQLEDSSAAQAGDAMTQARIDASNAAAGRLQTEEGMRLGSAQDIASREQQNASTIGQQAQQAITSLGEQGISEADTQRAAGLAGVEAGGQAAINTAEYGDTAASQRAGEIAGQRTQTAADIQNTQYQQGVQTGSLTSQGAQTVGNARRQGQQSYISGEQGQEQMGQQGQEQNQQAQIGAYQAKTGAANTAEGIATAATGDTRGQGASDKAGSAFANLEDGGIVNPAEEEGNEDNVSDHVMRGSNPGIGDRIVGGALAALGLEDGGIIGDDDPAAQMPTDAGPGVDGTYNYPKPGFRTQFKNAMGRYGAQMLEGGPQGVRKTAGQMIGQGIGYGIGKLAGAVGLAKGGYVNKPTLAMIGERGPEMVVPLNRTPSTKLPASTLKTAAQQIPGVGNRMGRYKGMRPPGPPDFSRPMAPMGGSLSAR